MQENRLAWISLSLLTVLPLLTADARIALPPVLRVFLGVTLFAGMIGFLTPMLVDRWAGGDPDRAGRAYAVNVLGCILGPLLCGFVLLPLLAAAWCLWDRNVQCLWDKLGRTYVGYSPRGFKPLTHEEQSRRFLSR